MAYEEKYRLTDDRPHTMTVEQRTRVTLTGVSDVESFDESAVVINTAQGVLIVRGSGLHVGKLSLETGDMTVDGSIDSVEYEDSARPQGGFFTRMFR